STTFLTRLRPISIDDVCSATWWEIGACAEILLADKHIDPLQHTTRSEFER
uniref:Uncharacterized protein n=1 Tax=Parascaris univalens TaxID=6257 RepID=A0A914ZX44_PARUN